MARDPTEVMLARISELEAELRESNELLKRSLTLPLFPVLIVFNPQLDDPHEMNELAQRISEGAPLSGFSRSPNHNACAFRWEP